MEPSLPSTTWMRRGSTVMILGQTTSPLKKEGRFRYFSISIHSGSLICKKTFHYIRDFFSSEPLTLEYMHNTHKLCIHFSDFKTCRIFSMHAKALLIALTLSFAHLIGFWLRSAIHQHKLDFPCCFCSNTAAAAACSFSLCFYSFSKLESAFACLNKAEFHPFTSMTWTSSFKF